MCGLTFRITWQELLVKKNLLRRFSKEKDKKFDLLQDIYRYHFHIVFCFRFSQKLREEKVLGRKLFQNVTIPEPGLLFNPQDLSGILTPFPFIPSPVIPLHTCLAQGKSPFVPSSPCLTLHPQLAKNPCSIPYPTVIPLHPCFAQGKKSPIHPFSSFPPPLFGAGEKYPLYPFFSFLPLCLVQEKNNLLLLVLPARRALCVFIFSPFLWYFPPFLYPRDK